MTYLWKMDVPHSSYLISLAGRRISPSTTTGCGDLPLDYYVAKHVDEATGAALHGQDAAG